MMRIDHITVCGSQFLCVLVANEEKHSEAQRSLEIGKDIAEVSKNVFEDLLSRYFAAVKSIA